LRRQKRKKHEKKNSDRKKGLAIESLKKVFPSLYKKIGGFKLKEESKTPASTLFTKLKEKP